jgi:hypothetical protein
MSIQATNASITGLHLSASLGPSASVSADAQSIVDQVAPNAESASAGDLATALQQLEESMAAMRQAAQAQQEIEAYLEAQRLLKQMISLRAQQDSVKQVSAANVLERPENYSTIGGPGPVVRPSEAPPGTLPAHSLVDPEG